MSDRPAISSDILAAFWFLANKQSVVEDNHGNVSYCDGKIMTIKPSGMSYLDIGADDLVDIDMNTGFHLMGHGKSGRKPSVDTSQHMLVYKMNPGVQSICHTHSPYATAMAIRGINLDVLCTEHADYFGHPIRVMPYADMNNWGNITLEENEQAVLLGNHGVLICSRKPDPMSAVKLAVALEAITKKYSILFSMGVGWDERHFLKDDEIKRWYERYQNSYGQ